MVHAKVLQLLLGFSVGLTVAQITIDDDRGDDPDLADMIAARNVQERTLQITESDVYALYTVHDINGTLYDPNSTEYTTMLPYQDPTLRFTELNFTNALFSAYGGMIEVHESTTPYHSIALNERAANNLGGLGPNNGLYSWAGSTPSDTMDGTSYQAHPNFIRMNDVTFLRGTRIAMRIDNTSEYKVAKPAMNDFNGFNFQINLQPLYNTSGATPGTYQPFFTDYPFVTQFIETALQITLKAENCNSVSLFYSFFDQDTGVPVELEEFMISFYDFDQDHADGDRAYLRESMYVTNFTTMFLSADTSLEYEFSPQIGVRMAAANNALYTQFLDSLAGNGPSLGSPPTPLDLSSMYRGGLVPIRTIDNWPWTEDRRLAIHTPAGWQRGEWPPTGSRVSAADLSQLHAEYGYSAGPTTYSGPYQVSAAEMKNVYSSGVVLRSTQQGTGPAKFPKVAWAGCQGECANGRTPPSAGFPTGEFCNYKSLTCDETWMATVPWANAFGSLCNGRDTRCGPPASRFTNHMTRFTDQFVGCGFVNNGIARFDEGLPITVGARNMSWGSIAEFQYPVGCIANVPRYDPTLPVSATNSLASINGFASPLDAALYDDNMACILDCPRTAERDDFGNPTDKTQAAKTPQHRNRAATFLFRQRQNFTVLFRTEIGAAVVALMENDTPNLVRSDLVDKNLQWMDTIDDPYYRGRSRIFSPSDTNPAGRNFLISGFNILIPQPPPTPPPPSPPPPSPPPPIPEPPPSPPPPTPPPPTPPPPLPPPPSPPPCACPPGTCNNIPASSCCSNPLYVCVGSGTTYGTCPTICFPFSPVVPSPFPKPPPLPPPPSPPPPSAPPPSSPPRPSCPLCYYIKWNGTPLGGGTSYKEVRPVFPVDQVPQSHPMLSYGLNPGATCATIAASMKWFWWDFNTLSANQFLTTVGRTEMMMPGVNAFYAYSYPYSWSANTGLEVSNTINMFFLQDANMAFFHFYIIDKAWDGSGGDYSMTLSGMPPVFGVSNHPIGADMPSPGSMSTSGGPISYHDAYPGSLETHGPTSTTYDSTTMPVVGTLPIMLRDDPWNKYTYNASTGRYQFHWYWLECCTDGMVLGPMPDASTTSIGFNVTYEADCARMVGLDQGTRISMWNPLGPAYNPGGCNGAPLREPVAGVPRAANWIHYDVPMDQTCTWTSGIQLSALPCVTACSSFTNCGECNSQIECGWDDSSQTCEAACAVGAGSLTIYGETCSVCSSKDNAFDCMCEPGCGWAPLDYKSGSASMGMCISGTPDYPSNQSVTVVQWETKGCPADCSKVASPTGIPGMYASPPECCPAAMAAPKSQCYRASYNEKSAFASVKLMDEYGVMPATSYPAHHPKVAMGVAGGASATATIPCLDMWSKTGDTSATPGPTVDIVNGSVAFFAYSHPKPYSSNTGYEADNSMVTFLVQGDDCNTYILVLVDRPGDGTGGYLKLNMTTTGVVSDDSCGAPISFLNDPQGRFDTYDSCGDGVVSWEWDGCCNDGMVVGPLPYGRDWSVNLKAITKETRGLDTFKIGTYDAERNDIGFVTANIRKATPKWGGLQYDSMECTSWCQRYTDCTSCFRDEQCQFSHAHGGCIAKDAYIYDFGCARPSSPLTTKIMQRGGDAYERESRLDGFDSQLMIRYGLPALLDMTCPCAQKYRICVTIYDENMQPVAGLGSSSESSKLDHQGVCVPPRLDYQYTFVDFGPQLTDNTLYHAYSYLCVEQGTLARDDCSPVQIDTFTLQLAPPPPSPPPPATVSSS